MLRARILLLVRRGTKRDEHTAQMAKRDIQGAGSVLMRQGRRKKAAGRNRAAVWGNNGDSESVLSEIVMHYSRYTCQLKPRYLAQTRHDSREARKHSTPAQEGQNLTVSLQIDNFGERAAVSRERPHGFGSALVFLSATQPHSALLPDMRKGITLFANPDAKLI